MLDPFVYGRDGPASGDGLLGFAPDQQTNLPPDVALAYAGILKAPPKPASYGPTWSVWGMGFGGSGSFDGNAAVGSTDLTASTYGFAAGADYHAAPDTVLGFALAGAGTNWGLAQGSAQAGAMRSRPASIAPNISARLTSAPRLPSPTTGSPPTASRSAINSPRTSRAKVLACEWKAVIATQCSRRWV
jgi:hypothetical protein